MNVPVGVVGLTGRSGPWNNIGAHLPPEWRSKELPGANEILNATDLLTWSFEPGECPVDGMRFLAGLPVEVAAERVGVLAVFDKVTRELTAGERNTLECLRALAADALRQERGDFSPDADIDFMLDMSGRFAAIRTGFEAAGYTASELVGTNILDLVPAPERDEVRDRLLAQFGSGISAWFDLEFESKTGRRMLFAFRTHLLFEHGSPVGIQAHGHDLTSAGSQLRRRREAESELRVKTQELGRFGERLRELHRLNTTPFGSLDEMYANFLVAGCAMFRLDTGFITDLKGAVIARHSLDTDLPAPALSAPVYCGGESFGTLAFGSALDSGARTFNPQDHDLLDLMAQSVGHAVHTARLQEERDVLNLHLQLQLRQDMLTGLPNRLGMFEWLVKTLAEAKAAGQRVALLFVDLDRFKQINDTLGHAAGDDLLEQVARRLTSYSSTQDHVSRIGGDEFTFVLTGNPSDEEISLQAGILLEGLRSPYVVNQYELFITASIGVSVYPDCGSDPAALLKCADAAMYRAKSRGKNDFQFFTTDLVARTMSRLDLETQLRRAIDNGELEMRFQPIARMDSQLAGLEVLLAWNNAKFGKVVPDRFIPIAEESGMIVPIGAWVLQHACAQNASWLNQGYAAVRMAVNVSALQFARTDFVDQVANTLRASGLPPEFLELELTESLVMQDVEESARRMARLRELGIRMSIDDFGTGYSSLSYLRKLPVDSLKIDKSFLVELSGSQSSRPLIQTIVVLAHNLGLSVVAEGVETEEQLQALREAGCDKVQGHLIGAPLRAAEVLGLLARNASVK